MKNRNWLTIKNNLLVHRHLCQNDVSSDVVRDPSEEDDEESYCIASCSAV